MSAVAYSPGPSRWIPRCRPTESPSPSRWPQRSMTPARRGSFWPRGLMGHRMGERPGAPAMAVVSPVASTAAAWIAQTLDGLHAATAHLARPGFLADRLRPVRRLRAPGHHRLHAVLASARVGRRGRCAGLGRSRPGAAVALVGAGRVTAGALRALLFTSPCAPAPARPSSPSLACATPLPGVRAAVSPAATVRSPATLVPATITLLTRRPHPGASDLVTGEPARAVVSWNRGV